MCLPGIKTEAIYKSLKTKIATLINHDKHCLLCIIDEMVLKTNLFYNIGRDEIVGFNDMGNGETNFEAAHHVRLIMARGLYNNWKQRIGYFLSEVLPLQGKNILEVKKIKNLQK